MITVIVLTVLGVWIIVGSVLTLTIGRGVRLADERDPKIDLSQAPEPRLKVVGE